MSEQETVLSPEILEQIDHWVAKFPADQKQSAILPALTIVQDNHEGWLSEDLINAVADYLEMPRIAAFEAATFYSMFDLEKTGKYKINVCTNISCMLCGSDEIVEHLQRRLNIKVGETTKDGKFTLRGVECLAACVDAPVLEVDKKYFRNLTPERIDELLSQYDVKIEEAS